MKKPKISENEKKIKTEFQKRLDILMILSNTTNKQLAEILNVAVSTVSNYKAVEGRLPCIESLLIMANYFGVTIDFLLGNSGYFEANLGTIDNPNRINFKKQGIVLMEATSKKSLK